MTEHFSSQGLKWVQTSDGPAIVTVINNVNLITDIKRDIQRVTGIKSKA